MSWEDQGRQEHGWFGHGTAPLKDRGEAAGPDPIFKPDAYAPRIDAIAHTALAHLPRQHWHRAALSFDQERLQRLRTAMTAWIGGRSLGNAAFNQRFFDSTISDAAAEKLRAAAEGVRTATSHQDLAQASADLAAGMQAVGLDRWAGFLRNAASRAEPDQLANGRIVLAQAATNTATDATPASPPSAPSPQGRYVADDPRRWIGQNSVGTGECVPLVQQATGAPQSTLWKPGVPVQGNTNIRPGTAMATFDKNGHYHGHAAIYLGQDADGIQVIDQWNNRDHAGRITSQQIPHERTIQFGMPKTNFVNQGEYYRVVE